jgi:DNA-binding response OmpR family regulator
VNALVVSSTPCNDVQKYLRAAGSHITTAQDGQDAISHAAHASYDLAVLVSTGKGMDLVETYFNLRDINPWMEIIILSDEPAKEWDRTADVIARAFPNTRSLTIDGLARVLGVVGDGPT